MTLNEYKALEQYFHAIINQPKKETTMMLKLSMWFTEQLENFKKLWTKETTFVEVDPKAFDEDYWAFEMYTGQWYSDERDELVPEKHTCIIEPNDSTWMVVLDKVIDELEKHYGYDIKSRVYYSVEFPLNDLDHEGKPMAGYGRCLNDEVLQQLLLAFPQAYYWTDAGDIYK